jgi:hypothetical protein
VLYWWLGNRTIIHLLHLLFRRSCFSPSTLLPCLGFKSSDCSSLSSPLVLACRLWSFLVGAAFVAPSFLPALGLGLVDLGKWTLGGMPFAMLQVCRGIKGAPGLKSQTRGRGGAYRPQLFFLEPSTRGPWNAILSVPDHITWGTNDISNTLTYKKKEW